MADGGSEKLDSLSIERIAADCLGEAKGSEENALWLLKARVLNNPSLRAVVLDPLLESACRDLLRRCRHLIRSHIATPAARGVQGLEALAQTWFDWPLRSGQRLGDAKRADLQGEADWCNKLSRTYGNQSSFFLQLAKGLVADKTVKQAFTNEQLSKLAKDSGVSKEAA